MSRSLNALIIIGLFLFSFSQNVLASFRPKKTITVKEEVALNDVRVEKGGMVKLEQYLKKSKDLKNDEPILIEFKCAREISRKKGNVSGLRNCSIQNYTIVRPERKVSSTNK